MIFTEIDQVYVMCVLYVVVVLLMPLAPRALIELCMWAEARSRPAYTFDRPATVRSRTLTIELERRPAGSAPACFPDRFAA